ncbi:hypothetical protein Scep_025457 [Stephania cephalantha]|uniref:Uncharacterized protein n=1 Tax=Stephania cephalantha TaxID=152367 RepID=A0AAP0HMC0_9MAGN
MYESTMNCCRSLPDCKIILLPVPVLLCCSVMAVLQEAAEKEIARMSRTGMAMGAQGLQDGPEQRCGNASGGGGEDAGTAGCVAWR